MKIKGVIDCDIVNYKKPSLYIAMPYCSFKCDKENGEKLCQNSFLMNINNVEVTPQQIINDYYLSNTITQAVVFGGLEPFDSYKDMLDFIKIFRSITEDDIVIYTGYYEHEIFDAIKELKHYPNIIIKFGRFIPNHSPIKDEILGVNLASKNQFAVKIS